MAAHLSAHDKASKCKHGQAAILELLHLEFVKVARNERSKDTTCRNIGDLFIQV